MSRQLWIDAQAGVAGDMLLAALLDAGADLGVVQGTIDEVLPDAVRLSTSRVTRCGLRALAVEVTSVAEHHPHRRWATIRDRLEAARLPERVRERSLAAFEMLARAEATVHGVAVEDVRFHEVGSWDSIADVVGVCAALHDLRVEQLSHSPIRLGSGRVRTAHGVMPVPVPAVLELLRMRGAVGFATHRSMPEDAAEGELATPTGVALLAALCGAEGSLGTTHVEAVGVGAGTRDTPGHPNVVRAVLSPAGPAPEDASAFETLHVLEANVDDLEPRLWPGVIAALLEAGARDAWLTPMLGKKGRPGHVLCVLADGADLEDLRGRIFELTPTLGARSYPVVRRALTRAWRDVTIGGDTDSPLTVRVKIATHQGRIVRATPEFEDVARCARTLGISELDAMGRAAAAAREAGLAPAESFEST